MSNLTECLRRQRDQPHSSSDSAPGSSAQATDDGDEYEDDDDDVGDHFAPLNDVSPRRRSSRVKAASSDDVIEDDGLVIHVPHQEEVNALDLESLQLQDKEINPDLLTKLEKIGSGGFKVRADFSIHDIISH